MHLKTIARAVGLTLLTALPAVCANAAPTRNPANGHYYDLINTALTWSDADTAAGSLFNLGYRGHLVTITDAAENLWLTSTFLPEGLHYHWTGGLQPLGANEPAGGWSWITGELFGFENWASPGEPNNTGGNEDRLVFDHGVSANGKQWNDIPGSIEAAGYVVEFDGAAPEPATLGLIGAAALAVPLWRRRRTQRAG